MLRLLQRTGHRPIVLLGGGTSKVGDPSDKDDMRPLLSDAEPASRRDGLSDYLQEGTSDVLDWLEGGTPLSD